ncbi:hypothetical protein DAETH_43580 (plasmid) [Deinococcus aetherius]|uniref:Uncharacterized protein n=1 Tax=Deinococcus aetherius TaxID=200252 RepID=A0ABN6RNB4_9DEIO|nr:hypothetical protein [Deinococcus aetherius]BDP44389.1 hypothetical protein DAETH_43580 [Deinococcus aetherius]
MNVSLAAPLVLTLVGASLAAAAPGTPPKPTLTIQRVVTATVGGKQTERLEAAATTRPGDLLQASSVLMLSGKEKGARFTVPVPANTTFVPGSARASQGVRVTYALNPTGPFSTTPMKAITVQENGKAVTKEVPAPQNEYRAVRYDLTGLSGTVTVGHRIRVN